MWHRFFHSASRENLAQDSPGAKTRQFIGSTAKVQPFPVRILTEIDLSILPEQNPRQRRTKKRCRTFLNLLATAATQGYDDRQIHVSPPRPICSRRQIRARRRTTTFHPWALCDRVREIPPRSRTKDQGNRRQSRCRHGFQSQLRQGKSQRREFLPRPRL